MTKTPTVEESLAALAAARKQLAAHRLAPLQAAAGLLAGVDLAALAGLLGKAADLMETGVHKTLFTNYATALPGLGGQVEAAIKAAKEEAGA